MRRALTAFLLVSAAAPLAAQSLPELSGRMDRVEKELRAVQRKVFPGGNPDYFEPQIQAAPAPVTPDGAPAASVVSDLTQRVGALEAQVRQLTNQSEVNNHRLDMLEQGYAKTKADTDYRLSQVEGGAAGVARPGVAAPPAGGETAPFGPSGRQPPPSGVRAAPPPAATGDPSEAPVAPPSSAAPRTGDPAEDGYLAGYTLWTQKRYADAETQLKQVVARYPTSKRASYAQNLLGRAYMDDGQLSSAADAFLTSYKKYPRGERAPDSLYYLGLTLTRLKKQGQACQVFDELRDVYGATLNATLKTRVAQGRADAKCGA